jgi:hypothetical protein
VTPGRDGDSKLEQQRARVDAAFREGWVPVGAGEPLVLSEPAYTEAHKVISRGGWTGLDREILEAVREGARPGDALSPLRPRPYIDHVTDAEVIVHGDDPRRRVAVLFSHDHFPGSVSATGSGWSLPVSTASPSG